MVQCRAIQRFRVIIDGISFYTTASAIRHGVGDHMRVNAAILSALEALESLRTKDPAVGVGGTWHGHQVQLSMMEDL